MVFPSHRRKVLPVGFASLGNEIQVTLPEVAGDLRLLAVVDGIIFENDLTLPQEKQRIGIIILACFCELNGRALRKKEVEDRLLFATQS